MVGELRSLPYSRKCFQHVNPYIRQPARMHVCTCLQECVHYPHGGKPCRPSRNLESTSQGAPDIPCTGSNTDSASRNVEPTY